MTVENLHISPHFAQQIISGHARTDASLLFHHLPSCTCFCSGNFALFSALGVSSCKVRLGCFVDAIFSSLLLSFGVVFGRGFEICAGFWGFEIGVFWFLPLRIVLSTGQVWFLSVAARFPYLNRSAGKTNVNRLLFTAILPKRV